MESPGDVTDLGWMDGFKTAYFSLPQQIYRGVECPSWDLILDSDNPLFNSYYIKCLPSKCLKGISDYPHFNFSTELYLLFKCVATNLWPTSAPQCDEVCHTLVFHWLAWCWSLWPNYLKWLRWIADPLPISFEWYVTFTRRPCVTLGFILIQSKHECSI